jgi:hypothetical protein
MVFTELSFALGDDAMHIIVAVSFLIVCMLLAETKALSVDTAARVIIVADMTQVVVPDVTQYPRQQDPDPMLQQQNQMDSALERLRNLAEEEEDLLKILD